jgi:hypothetical protein
LVADFETERAAWNRPDPIAPRRIRRSVVRPQRPKSGTLGPGAEVREGKTRVVVGVYDQASGRVTLEPFSTPAKSQPEAAP